MGNSFQVASNYDDEDEDELYSPGINNSPTGVFFGITPDEGEEYREGSLADQSIDDVSRMLISVTRNDDLSPFWRYFLNAK